MTTIVLTGTLLFDGDEPTPDAVVIIGGERIVAAGRGVEPPPDVRKRLPHLMANLRTLRDAGALCTVGSDAGLGPIKPHDAIRYAVAQLGPIGFTPAEALRAVTSVAARVCGLGETKGRLAPGYDADILAVDGDPAVIHRIRAVCARGLRVR